MMLYLSTKFAYNLIRGENQVVGAMIKWKALWKLPLPQRVLLFGWKCLNNAIQVRKLLHSKSISSNALCPICNKLEESIEHALFLCEHARASWFGSN